MTPDNFAAWVNGGYWALAVILAVLAPPVVTVYVACIGYRIARDMLYDHKRKKARRTARLAKLKLNSEYGKVKS